MGYQAPTYEELLTLADALPYNGKNPQRTSFQALLKRIVQKYRANAALQDEAKSVKELLGAFVFELEIIREVEYHGHLPEKQQGWLYNTGSEFYTTIANRLHISELDNPIVEEERLIYLFKFYQYMKQQHPEETGWIRQIHERLKRLKERSMPRIVAVLEAPPKLDILIENIGRILNEYPKIDASRFFHNKNRLQMLKFIQFINQTCDQIYPVNTNAKTDVELQMAKLNMINSCNVRMGVVIFALVKIFDEYKVLSPRGSELFKMCLTALNLKNLDKISRDDKIILLKANTTHIATLKQLETTYDALIQEWQTKGLQESDLNTFYKEIAKFTAIEEENKTKASLPAMAGTAVAQQAVGMAAGFVLPGIIGAAAGGPIGFAVSLGGSVIWSFGIRQLIARQAMSQMVGYLYSWAIDKISAAAVTTTVGAFGIVYSLAQGGLAALLSRKDLPKKDKEFIDEWIGTLLSLPDDIMSKKEKDELRFVLHIPESANTLTAVEEIPEEMFETVAAAPGITAVDVQERRSSMKM